jgi:hypothetical protein
MIKFSQPKVSRKKGNLGLKWLGSVSKKDLVVNSWWKKQEIEICGVYVRIVYVLSMYS